MPRVRAVKNGVKNRISSLLWEMSRQLAVIPAECLKNIDKESWQLRIDILNLDGKCEYCRRRDANTVDHFRSLVRNGAPTVYCNDIWNSIPSCAICNSSKGNRTFKEWMETPSKCSPRHSLSEEELDVVIDKFNRYDSLFAKYSLKKQVDPEWWAGLSDDLTKFLKIKQIEVDGYQKTCVVEGNTIVYAKKVKQSEPLSDDDAALKSI